jgi:hypothetical protein
MGRGKPRYHPAWLVFPPIHSLQQPDLPVIGCASIAAPAVRTTYETCSPARLGRELRLVSLGLRFQSMPRLPCLNSPVYFPPSTPDIELTQLSLKRKGCQEKARHSLQLLTSVPIGSPMMARVNACGSHRFSTRMGSLFSMHSDTAVLSITPRRFCSTSM